jgi:hypothetical protein
LPNVFQIDFSSIRKAAPPKEPESKPFLEKPEPCQTGPQYLFAKNAIILQGKIEAR